MKHTKTTFLLILNIFLALFLISAFIFFFQVIKHKNQHASATLTTLATRVAMKDNSTAVMEAVKNAKESRTTLTNYFLDPTTIDTFVNQIEELGTEANAKLLVKNVAVSTIRKNTISIDFSLVGTFPQVVHALALVEHMPYQVHLKTMYINKTTAAPDASVDGKKSKSTVSLPLWQVDAGFDVVSLQ